MKTNAMYSCANHQPLAARNDLLMYAKRNEQRASEPAMDDDMLRLQGALRPALEAETDAPLTAGEWQILALICGAILAVGAFVLGMLS